MALLDLEQVTDCCALDLVSGFYTKEMGNLWCSPKSDLVADLDKILTGQRLGSGGFYKRGGCLLTLNDTQKPHWEADLLERGFTMIAGPIVNPNSDQSIYIYLIDHKQENNSYDDDE